MCCGIVARSRVLITGSDSKDEMGFKQAIPPARRNEHTVDVIFYYTQNYKCAVIQVASHSSNMNINNQIQTCCRAVSGDPSVVSSVRRCGL